MDPEAARIVFRSGLPITMHGLDVTHKALMGLAEADRLDALGTRVGRVFADLLRFFTRFHVEQYGTADTPIHDAVAVAHVALPGPRDDAPLPRGRGDHRRHHAGPDRRGRPRPAGCSRRTWTSRWTSTGPRSRTS